MTKRSLHFGSEQHTQAEGAEVEWGGGGVGGGGAYRSPDWLTDISTGLLVHWMIDWFIERLSSVAAHSHMLAAVYDIDEAVERHGL